MHTVHMSLRDRMRMNQWNFKYSLITITAIKDQPHFLHSESKIEIFLYHQTIFTQAAYTFKCMWYNLSKNVSVLLFNANNSKI